MTATTQPRQADLFGDQTVELAAPEGLTYQPSFISRADELGLLAALQPFDFTPFQFHGYEGKRRVHYFGWRYDYDARAVAEVEPIPEFLLSLREQLASFADVPADAFQQALVNQYDAGAGIGWHRDKPQFGDVVGVSLLSACTLRFRLPRQGGWQRHNQPLAPRSAYHLTGPARVNWEHSIASHDAARYSITFRTLR